MKNFQQYLAESERTYNYRIKIVGDVAPDFVRQLEDKLKQFFYCLDDKSGLR